MTNTNRLDEAIRQHMVQAQRDLDLPTDRPVIGWLLVAAVMDPTDQERPDLWIVDPDGTPSFVTSGLLHEAWAERLQRQPPD